MTGRLVVLTTVIVTLTSGLSAQALPPPDAPPLLRSEALPPPDAPPCCDDERARCRQEVKRLIAEYIRQEACYANTASYWIDGRPYAVPAILPVPNYQAAPPAPTFSSVPFVPSQPTATGGLSGRVWSVPTISGFSARAGGCGPRG